MVEEGSQFVLKLVAFTFNDVYTALHVLVIYQMLFKIF